MWKLRTELHSVQEERLKWKEKYLDACMQSGSQPNNDTSQVVSDVMSVVSSWIHFVDAYMLCMTAIIMMRLRFCQNEFAKFSYLPNYKSYEETNCTVIKGFQN